MNVPIKIIAAGTPNIINLKMAAPWLVTSPAVAPAVIPAQTAVKPTTPLEIAPPNLSSKGRTDKVKDSSR